MRVLFVHPNFPAQFRYIAAALGQSPENEVVFATANERLEWVIKGVRKVLFDKSFSPAREAHPLAGHFDQSCRVGESAMNTLLQLRKSGFVPDVTYATSGWGSSLFIKDVFPETRLIGYFEWFYDPRGADALFGTKGSCSLNDATRSRTRNASILMDLAACDAAICPTHWQKAQFPARFRSGINVRHDGIDTGYFIPDPKADLPPEAEAAGSAAEIVTYATRGMEPYRGFPQFMDALPKLLEERPGCHVIIAGEDRACYGPRHSSGKTWKEIMLEQVKFDASRVHFTGPLPYARYRALLQCSTAHVYLTRPFVLSWSLLEAMSCGCCVVASDTEPVREVIANNVNGLLTPFHSPDKLTESLFRVLDDKQLANRLRGNARKTVAERYALSRLIPRHLSLLNRLASPQKR